MMTVQTEGDSRVKTNDQVSITFAAETCHLFDAQGQALQRAERHPMADLGREPAMAQA